MEDEHWGEYALWPDVSEMPERMEVVASGPHRARGFRAEVDGARLLFMPPAPSCNLFAPGARKVTWVVSPVVLGKVDDAELMTAPRTATAKEIVETHRAERLLREMPEARLVLHIYGRAVYRGENWHAAVARDIGVEERDVEAWACGCEPPPEPGWLYARLSRSVDRISDAVDEHERLASQASRLANRLEPYRNSPLAA